MTRLFSALALLVTASATLSAAPVPTTPPDPTKDREGNPLPKGATARLGSHVFCGPANHGITFSPDGKRILSITENGFIGWDANTGKRLPKDASPLFSLKTEWPPELSGNYFVTFQNNLSQIGATEKSTTIVTVIDTDGKKVSQFDLEPGHSSRDPHAITPDGKRFVIFPYTSTGPQKVWVFELPSGKLIRTHEVAKHGEHIYVSPDSKTLFVPEQFRPLRRFDLDNGKELAALTSGEEFPNRLIISPDSKTVISSCQYRFSGPTPDFGVFHDLTTGKPVGKREFKGGNAFPCLFVGPREVIAFAVLPRSGYLRQMFTLSRWNLDTMKCAWEVPTPIYRPVLSPDGKRLASSSGAHIILHDTATGKRLDSSTGHVGSVGWIGFSRDGQTVTTIDTREVMKWSLNGEQKSVREPPEHRDRWAHSFDVINPLVWVTSPDGKKRELVSWDFEKNEIAWRMPLEPDQITQPNFLFSHDGKRVVTFSQNGNTLDTNVSDGPTGKKLHSWPLKNIQAIVGLSADGKTLFVHDGEIAGLNVETGKETVRTKIKLRTGTLSADGTRFAHARPRDRFSPAMLVVYDTKTAKEIVDFDLGDISTDWMTPMFSANGKWVAARTETHVLVGDVESTTSRKLDADSACPTCMAFSPNGASLAVGYNDGTALIWDLTAK